MKLYHISLNNLRRRKARMLFLIFGLTVGVATVVGLITITRAMEHEIAMTLDQFGANIIIVPKSDDLTLSYGGVTVASAAVDLRELSQADLSKIWSIKNAESISTIAPKLFGLVEVGGKRALLAGIDPKEEIRLKKWWRVSGKPPEGDSELLVGAEAAHKLSLTVGSRVDLHGQAFTVCGLLDETGSQDDALLFAPLTTVQRLFGKADRLSMAEVAALCNTCPIEEIVRQTSEILPGAKVMAIKQTIASRMETVAGFRTFSYGISAILLVIGALVVFISMMSSVNERKREIGIFRAIGFRRSHVLTIILTEALLVSSGAGILGALAGYGIVLFAAPVVSGMGHLTIPFQPSLTIAAIGLAIVVGILSSIYPAVQAARMDPTVALRAL